MSIDIDNMPAGPEMDELVCKAVGLGPEHDGRESNWWRVPRAGAEHVFKTWVALDRQRFDSATLLTIFTRVVRWTNGKSRPLQRSRCRFNSDPGLSAQVNFANTSLTAQPVTNHRYRRAYCDTLCHKANRVHRLHC